MLLSLALIGCAVPPSKPPAAAAELESAGRAAKAQFSKAMGSALNGDMKAALQHFDQIDRQSLSAKQQTALASAVANFSTETTQRPRPGLDAWVAKVLGLYETYWVRVMTGRVTAPAGERELADALAPLVGAPGQGASTLEGLEPLLQKEIRARGYHSLHGVTPPYREFMLWRTQLDQAYQVELPEGSESVLVSMLDDFVSLGWLGFATGDYYHSGGWATHERLFCIRKAYDLDSESFRVSYLGHEAQHFSDYKRFPKLEAPELEYRAKLVEIAMADTTLHSLLEAFTHNGSNSRDNPHGHANRRLMGELSGALGVTRPEGSWWEALPQAQVRAAALRLLKQDSQLRSGKGAA